MLANRTDILQYIPQRKPIVMVHELLEADDDHIVTHLAIEPENVFVTSGFISEPGMVEKIAQTAAVHVGYQCSLEKLTIPIDYIAAIKDLKINEDGKEN